jgi:acetyl-CoA carboxylase biotin carboxylase subunit
LLNKTYTGLLELIIIQPEMIKKLLIANRGEIALRIMRSCREMGIRTVAVYSEADRTSMHVRYADEAYLIGPAASSESYLKIENIIKAAHKSHADAIHPGYGFLSENAEFAKICGKEGFIFIGPSPHAISTMGDKISARRTMLEAGVPVVPGTMNKIVTKADTKKIVDQVGLPLIVKASAGGGGKGMRLVEHESELMNAVNMARSEAMTAFGDDSVYIEKYIVEPHHIEFQILGDKYGNVIHLCERECSIQRRHQKIIEETPSPFITPALREEMGQVAITAARSVSYEGTGTIEFLVDKDYNYYFLEMNTRLQVEHPITERVVGIDLVKEQIRVANGETLQYQQSDIQQLGHAIECRIYAEDPDQNFMPSPGLIRHISEPRGLGIRTDGYVYPGYVIPIYYDPLISKLIIWARTRTGAIDRMKRALYEYNISGVKTSIKYLENIMNHRMFEKGTYDTHFIDKYSSELTGIQEPCDFDCEDLAVITAFMDYTEKLKKISATAPVPQNESSWKKSGRLRGYAY